MLGLAVFVACFVVAVVLAPLFLKLKDAELSDTFAIHDEKTLGSLCVQVVKQYKLAESAYQSGDLSKREWAAREQFLRGRYLDYALRLGKKS